MSLTAVQRVVITGGPGSGKTTLLAELASRGYATVEESARAIIAARVARGMSPRPELAEFAREILRQDIEKFRDPPRSDGPVFYDRGAVEAIAMLHETLPLADDELQSMLSTCSFDRTVFVLPPWQAIFVNDAERDQSFAHAVDVHAKVVRWYRACGYRLDEVPRLAVSHRADHVLRALADDGC